MMVNMVRVGMMVMVSAAVGCASLAEPTSRAVTTQVGGDPESVVNRFLQALRDSEVDSAEAMIAPVDERNRPQAARAQRQRLEQRARRMSAGQRDYRVIESKVAGDCAVVIVDEFIRDSQPSYDLDPVFLIRQEGRWQVLYYQSLAGNYALTDEQRTELGKLNDWFRQRQQEHRPARQPG
jgi:hypothetical protein